jgi:hypothetical protein
MWYEIENVFKITVNNIIFTNCISYSYPEFFQDLLFIYLFSFNLTAKHFRDKSFDDMK